ncbi:MAG TPA: hypothetical protein VF407_10925 [Polyangiaceae bacterium]
MKLTYAILGVFGVLLLTILLAAGCGSSKNGSGFDDGTSGGDGGAFGEGGKGFGGGDGDGAAPPALNCSNSGTVTGTVYAPNGTLPLYNVIVFTPSSALAPFNEGVSCDKCGTVSGNPLASTVTDSSGKFTLQVPPGDNVPLVMQVGKWRRQVSIPHGDVGCSSPLALTDPNLTRLPKNHTEGDMPHMAVTTGGCDSIACVLPKMGIDASEYGSASEYSSKRVIFYEGSGPSAVPGITAASNLWGDENELKKYDLAIFSCECSEHYDTKPAPAQQNVYDYLNAGGRTFGTDYMYTWMHTGIQTGAGSAAAPTDLQPVLQGFIGGAPAPLGIQSQQFDVNTTFPKGVALSEWLATPAVGASTTPGKVELDSVFSNFANIDPSLGQAWVSGLAGQSGQNNQDRIVSYTTPFSAAEADRCGKSYYMDVHVGSDFINTDFPSGCSNDFSPQEKMMVFFMMDLASCIQDDTAPVNPPR